MKMQSLQSQQQLHEKKKKTSEKLTQDHPDVNNVLIYHKFSSCHGMLALSGVDTACFGHQYTDFGHAKHKSSFLIKSVTKHEHDEEKKNECNV